jgi:hypothetical protein
MFKQNCIKLICVFALLILFSSACGSASSLVGKWKNDQLTFTFDQNGTLSIESASGLKATGIYSITRQEQDNIIFKDHVLVNITETGDLFKPTGKNDNKIGMEFSIVDDELKLVPGKIIDPLTWEIPVTMNLIFRTSGNALQSLELTRQK